MNLGMSARAPEADRWRAILKTLTAGWFLAWAGLAPANDKTSFFSPAAFEPGTDCRYLPAGAAGLN